MRRSTVNGKDAPVREREEKDISDSYKREVFIDKQNDDLIFRTLAHQNL